MNIGKCLLKVSGQVDAKELRAAIAEYARRGQAEMDANIAAVQDKLAELDAQEARIVEAVRKAWEADGAPKARAKKEEAKPVEAQVAATPAAVEEKAQTPMKKPRLAENADDLYRAIKKATDDGIVTDRGILYPVVRVLGVGNMRVSSHGVEVIENGGRTARDATKKEVQTLHEELEGDRAQVLVMTRWGGAGRVKDTLSQVHSELHAPRGLGFEKSNAKTIDRAQAGRIIGDIYSKGDGNRWKPQQTLMRLAKELVAAGLNSKEVAGAIEDANTAFARLNTGRLQVPYREQMLKSLERFGLISEEAPPPRKTPEQLRAALHDYETEFKKRIEAGDKEDLAHNTAMNKTGLTDDGLLAARVADGRIATYKPGIISKEKGAKEAKPEAAPKTLAEAWDKGVAQGEADHPGNTFARLLNGYDQMFRFALGEQPEAPYALRVAGKGETLDPHPIAQYAEREVFGARKDVTVAEAIDVLGKLAERDATSARRQAAAPLGSRKYFGESQDAQERSDIAFHKDRLKALEYDQRRADALAKVAPDQQGVKDYAAAVADLRQRHEEALSSVEQKRDERIKREAVEKEAAFAATFRPATPEELNKKPTPAAIQGWFRGTYKGGTVWTSQGHFVDLNGEPHTANWRKYVDPARDHDDEGKKNRVDVDRVVPPKYGAKMEPIAVQSLKTGVEAVIFKSGAETMGIDLRYVRYFQSKYKGKAEFHANANDIKNGVVTVTADGKTVGVAAPMRTDDLSVDKVQGYLSKQPTKEPNAPTPTEAQPAEAQREGKAAQAVAPSPLPTQVEKMKRKKGSASLRVTKEGDEYKAYVGDKYLTKYHDKEELKNRLRSQWGWEWDGTVEGEAAREASTANEVRKAEITAQLAKLQADYEKKSARMTATVPEPIRKSALDGIVKKMDKLEAELAQLGAAPEVLGAIEDYAGEHRPPGPDSGAPLYDLTGGGSVYPDDVYGPNGAQYYGHFGGNDALDVQTMSLIRSVRNNPNARVTIYRAIPANITTAEKIATLEAQMKRFLARNTVPEGERKEGWYDRASEELDRLRALPTQAEEAPTISPGDWVTINRAYAKDHGEGALNGNYRIISKTVTAKDLFTNGDSIHEFGYWPKGSYLGAIGEEQAPVPINPDSLSRAVLSRMDRTLVAMGYDSRGPDDVLRMLKERIARDGEIPATLPDWIAAYQKATEGERARQEKKAAKAITEAQATNVDFARARQLGLTGDLKEAGYIRPDGKLIDLSGKREGGQPGTRALDHREVGNGSKGMQEFMALGNVRMDMNSGSLDLAKAPTPQQVSVIRRIVAAHRGEVVIDLDDGLGEERESYYRNPERHFSREYPQGTKAERVIADIQRFFAGEEPTGLVRPMGASGQTPDIFSGQPSHLSNRDIDLWSQARRGVGAQAILADINANSTDPFYRQLAGLMQALGVDPKVMVRRGQPEQLAAAMEKYRASTVATYNPTTDTVALLRPQRVEEKLLHEFTHSATVAAIQSDSKAAKAMDLLYLRVKRAGVKAYGMENVFEFVTEGFVNPEFKAQLRALPEQHGFIRNAWDRFVDIVRSILGLPVSRMTALDQFISLGHELMVENAKAKGVTTVGGVSLGASGETDTRLYRGVKPDSDFERSVGRLYTKGLKDREEFWTTDRRLAEYYAKGGKVLSANIDPNAKVLTLIEPDGEINAKGLAFFEKHSGRRFRDDLAFFSHVMENGIADIRDAVEQAGFDAVHSMDLDGPETLVLNPGALILSEPAIGATPTVLGSIDESALTPQQAFLSKIGAGPDSIMERARHLHGNMKAQGLRAVLADALITLRQKTVDTFEAIRQLDEMTLGKDFASRILNPTDATIKAETSAWVLARMSRGAEGPLEALALDGPLKLKDGAITVEESGRGLLQLMAGMQGEGDRALAWIVANRSHGIMGRAAAADADIKAINRQLTQVHADKRAANKAGDLAAYKAAMAQQRELLAAKKDAIDRAGVRERLFTPKEVAAGMALNQGKMPDGQDRATVYRQFLDRFNAMGKSVLDIGEAKGLINGDERKLWEREFYVPFYRYMDTADDLRGPRMISGMVRKKAFERLRGGTEPLGDLLHNTLLNWHHILAASMANEAAALALDRATNLGSAQVVPSSASGKNVVWVMQDGKKRFYEVFDPRLLESISAISASSSNGAAMRLMGMFRRALTEGVTADPAYQARNVLRDTITTIAVSGISPKFWNTLRRGWQGTAKGTRTSEQMRAGGGTFHFGTVMGDDAQKARILIQREAKRMLDTPVKVGEFWKKIFHGYHELGSRLENLNRAALFEDMMAGKDDLLAANFAARDLLDFSQRGTAGAVRFITQTAPFVNSRLQGLDKLGRAFLDPRQRTRMLMTIGATAAASVLLYLAYKDDDDWKRREQWDRDNYWWWKIGDQAYRMPKPFEVGAFGTVAERLAELWTSDEATGKEFAQRLGSILADQFQFNPLPQLIRPALELWANKDFFTGRPIETPGMENLPSTERIGPYTSSAAIAASHALGGLASPAQIDHTVRGYLGWLGSTLTDMLDYAMEQAGVRPERSIAGARGIPFVSSVMQSFVPNMDRQQSKYLTLFYQQEQQINQAYQAYRNKLLIGDKEGAAQWLDENRQVMSLHTMASATTRMEGRLAAQIRQISRSDLPQNEKQARIDRLTALRNAIAAKAARTARTVTEGAL